MELFKLTDQKNETYGGMKWGEKVTHSIPKNKRKPVLCSSGVLHGYKNKNLALLINPIQANITKPKLWVAEGEIVVEDWGKCACYELTTVKQINIPKWYSDKKTRKKVQIQFAILCTESVLHLFEKVLPSDKRVRNAIKEAKKYLSNKPPAHADAAAYAADAAHAAHAAHAAAYAAYAAYAAARAADAAARAAADAAAYAAYAAADAAAYAAHAAAYAADAIIVNFNSIADKAIELIIKGS